MASDALARFNDAIDTANRLLSARDSRVNRLGRSDFYHASWTAMIASWDSFVKTICKEFLSKSNNSLTLGIPNNAVVSAQKVNHQALVMYERLLKIFNTPNFDNSRELILTATGVDFYSKWKWDDKNISSLSLKRYLDEAVGVRHSFAHGFPLRSIPNFSTVDGNSNLTYRKTIFLRGLLKEITAITDRELEAALMQYFYRTF